MLGTEATESAKEALREQLGLNRPVLVRYFDWLLSFIRGDFGMSYNYRMPVGEMLADKLPITMMLTGLSFLFTVVFSIPIGILAGSAKSKKSDVAITSVNQMVMSVPAFFIGILACYVFGNILRVFIPGNFASYTVSSVSYTHLDVYKRQVLLFPPTHLSALLLSLKTAQKSRR